MINGGQKFRFMKCLQKGRSERYKRTRSRKDELGILSSFLIFFSLALLGPSFAILLPPFIDLGCVALVGVMIIS